MLLGSIVKAARVGLLKLAPIRSCSSVKSFGPSQPRWPFDPDDDKDVVGNKETEHFAFDEEQGILQEPEDERKAFDQFVARFGESRFSNVLYAIQDRDYLVSRDAQEWRFVERLLPPDTVPAIPQRAKYPSGFLPPKVLSDSELLSSVGYYVSRTVNHMLPVYTDYYRYRNLVQTTIRSCDGDMYQLRDDLDAFLEQRYQMKFISQVHELYSKIVYRGDFQVDFKEFLLSKGF